MESKKIKELLDNYFEGQTSLQEEQQLRVYFNTTADLPASLRTYAPFFQYTHQAQLKAQAVSRKPQSYLSTWAIAASFLLLISLNLYHQNQGPQTDEIHKARMAYLQFKDGMDLVSKNLNKGTSKIVYVDYFEVTTNKIFK
jgi:hypothetical protein